MRGRGVGIIALFAAIAGCGGPRDRPLTPADRDQLAQDYESEETQKTLGVDPAARASCLTSTGGTRVQARNAGFSGADSFGTRGCPELPGTGKKEPPPDD